MVQTIIVTKNAVTVVRELKDSVTRNEPHFCYSLRPLHYLICLQTVSNYIQLRLPIKYINVIVVQNKIIYQDRQVSNAKDETDIYLELEWLVQENF